MSMEYEAKHHLTSGGQGIAALPWIEAYRQVQLSWPSVLLDETVFKDHLAFLGWTEGLPPFIADVYLSCACGHGNNAACLLFDRIYCAVVNDTIRSVYSGTDCMDEVLQKVREKLFVGPPPRLLKYSGKTPLEAWIRLVAKRTALDSNREEHRRIFRDVLPCGFSDSFIDSIETDLDYSRYKALIQSAIYNAIERLPQHNRTALHLHYGAGLGIDEICRVLGVHRSTVARWIQKGQIQLRRQFHHNLKKAFTRLSARELQGILAYAVCQLDLNIFRQSNILESEIQDLE